MRDDVILTALVHVELHHGGEKENVFVLTFLTDIEILAAWWFQLR